MISKELWGSAILLPSTIGEDYDAVLTAALIKFTAGLDGVTFRDDDDVVYPCLKTGSQTLAAAGTITPSAPLMYVQSSGGVVTLSATTAVADGSFDGQLLMIVGSHSTQQVIITDGANVDLIHSDSVRLALGQSLQLRWDATQGKWIAFGPVGPGTEFETNLGLKNHAVVKFYESEGNGPDFVSLGAPSSLASSYTLQLPSAQGGVNTFLKNNGSGVLSWGSTTSSLQAAYDGGEDIAVVAPINLTGSGVLLSVVGDVTMEDLTAAVGDFSSTLTAGALLTVSAGGADITGDSSVTGDFDVTADLTTVTLGINLNGTAVAAALDAYLGDGDVFAVLRGAADTAGDSVGIKVLKGQTTGGGADPLGYLYWDVVDDSPLTTDFLIQLNTGSGLSNILTATYDAGDTNVRVVVGDLAGAQSARLTVPDAESRANLYIRKTGGTGQCLVVSDTSGTNDRILDVDTGAMLDSAGVWTDAPCFKATKHDIRTVDTDEHFLAKFEKLSIQKYRRTPEGKLRHGMFLDELVELFGFDDKGISGTELASLALAGVKALIQRVTLLEEAKA